MANRRRQKRKQLKAGIGLTTLEVKPLVQSQKNDTRVTIEKTLLQRWLIPSKKQWNGWGLPAKFGYATGWVTVIGAVLGAFLAIYYGQAGATKDLQVEQGKKQDNQLASTAEIKSDIASIKKKMGILDDDQGVYWSNRYPNGYTLVTLLHGINQVIPFRDFIGDTTVNWNNFSFQYYPGEILITLPDIRFSDGDSASGNMVLLPLKSGSRETAGAFGAHPDIEVELAASEKYGDVIVIGLNPHIGRKALPPNSKNTNQ